MEVAKEELAHVKKKCKSESEVLKATGKQKQIQDMGYKIQEKQKMFFEKKDSPLWQSGIKFAVIVAEIALAFFMLTNLQGAKSRPVNYFLNLPDNFDGSQRFEARIHLASLEHSGEWLMPLTSKVAFKKWIRENLSMLIVETVSAVNLSEPRVFQIPFLFATGDICLSEAEKQNLRQYIEAGGTIFFDDADYADYDKFKKQIKIVFPGHKIEKIPNNHGIYEIYFKIKKPKPLEALIIDERIAEAAA